MRSLLKLVLILSCVQRGDSRRPRTLIGQKRDSSPQTPAEASGGPAARPRRSALDSQCGLRSILLQVRDLGLGYDSDEAVLFKYCSGACPPRTRSNHDLTLSNLLLSGVLPQPPPGELWHTPCCRPTHHEDMAFLDNSHRWHRVEKLSAAGCSCVG